MASFNVPTGFPIFHSAHPDLISDAIRAYSAGRFGYPQQESELIKSLIQNKYLPREKESEIGLRGAQSGLANLQSQLIREHLPYIKEEYETQNTLNKLKSDQANLKLRILAQYLGQGQNDVPSDQFSTDVLSSEIPSPNLNAPQSYGRLQNFSNQNNQPQQFNQPTFPESPSTNLGLENFISKELGLGDQKIVDVNNDKYALTGTGKLIPVAKGLTAYEEGLQKGLGKYASEAYGQSVNNVIGLQNRGFALDEMINAVKNDPEFFNVTGPVKSYFTKWAGNPAQQKLLGSLESASGEIKLQVAPYLKGAFTGKTQSMIEEVKANPKVDFPYVFYGKLKAQKLIDSAVAQIDNLRAEYIEKGFSPLEATKKAIKQVDLYKLRPAVDNMLDPIVTIRNQRGEEKQVKLSEAQKLKAKGA